MVKLAPLLVILICLHTHAAGQFLRTTCPKVSQAKCQGRARQLLEQEHCENGVCSIHTHQQQMRHLSALFEAAPANDPPEAVKPTTVSHESDDDTAELPLMKPIWWGSKQPTAAAVDFPAGGVPQRVMPDPSQGTKPPESQQKQANIVKHLEDIYGQDVAPGPATAAVPALPKSKSSPASAQPEDDVIITEAVVPDNQANEITAANTTASPKAAAVPKPGEDNGENPVAAAVLKPYSGPDSTVKNRRLTFLQNSKIKIGFDMDRAGVISWVSSPLMPGTWRDRNMINIWDQGRLLQQSFYGCVDGSCWATRPWLWNPVQGGSWENFPGQTVKQQVVAGKYIYVEGYGRNWGNQNLISDLLMSTNCTVKDNYAQLDFAITYTGPSTHPYMTQEVPAVFVDRRFSVLAYYDGTKPWTNDKVTYAFPGGRNIYARPTEFWAAYIDPDTGYGLGVLNLKSWMGITAYRVGDRDDDIGVRPWYVSYFALTIRMQLHPAMKKYNYQSFVVVGTLSQIRATFYKLRTMPGVIQKSSTAEGQVPRTGPDTTTEETEGQPDLGRNAYFGHSANYSAFKNVIDAREETPTDSTASPPTDPAKTPSETASAPAASTSATQAEDIYVKTGEGAGDALPLPGQEPGGAGKNAPNTYVIVGVVGAAVVGSALLVGAAVLGRRYQARRAAVAADAANQRGDGPAAAAGRRVAGQAPPPEDATAIVSMRGHAKGGKGGTDGHKPRASAALGTAPAT